MKKALTVALILFVICTISTVGYLLITLGLKDGQNLKLSGVDPSQCKNGTFVGQYQEGRWTNMISVTVKDGRITFIKLLKDVAFADEKVTKEIFDRVMKEQNTNIDVVTGATVTSKAYLKSIESALFHS